MFNSFLIAGFECTYARVGKQTRLDMLKATKHEEQIETDYRLIQQMGIATVREGLSWHHIDTGQGVYDFSRFEPLIKTGQQMNIQQIWDLNHFDYPDYLDPFSPQFITAFSVYAKAAIRVLRRYIKETIYIVPINEISFFAWIGADQGLWAPFLTGSQHGLAFKKQLVQAAIAAMDAIWAIDENVRFIQVDPFMRRVAKAPANAAAIKHVDEFNNIIRFEVWDMLSGKKFPELGGHPKYLDMIGVNYYIHNQEWVLSTKAGGIRHRMMSWNSPHRISFADLLQTIHARYRRSLVVTETGSFGRRRSAWWHRTLMQVDEALEGEIPIEGLCIYPTVDRPDSANFLLPNSGIFDFKPNDEYCLRIPHRSSVAHLSRYRRRIEAPVHHRVEMGSHLSQGVLRNP